jgi:SAM-dependent methyltransferase
LVRYVTVDGRIIIFPQNTGPQDWVANIATNPKVRIFGNHGVLEGKANVKRIKGLKDPLLGIFTRKYGQAEVRNRYWGQHRYVQVETSSTGASALNFEELVYGDLEAAFDGVAEDYDTHIFGNPMNRWLRNVSIGVMEQLFQPGDKVLEIGCGTGTETLSLAQRGVRVYACDISGKMLAVLERKANSRGLSNLITTIHGRPYQIMDRLREMGVNAIDGAYSTYGAINTDPKLVELFRGLHRLIKPRGRVLLGVWNKYCLFEIGGYAVRLKPSMSVARLRNPVPVGKSRFCVSTNSFSVGSLNALLAPYFDLERVFGVEILLPPSNLTRYLPREPVLSWLKRIDLAIGSAYPWNRLGDHFLGVYSRASN